MAFYRRRRSNAESTLGGYRLREVEFGGIGPEPFQSVVLALLLLKEVDDDITEIEQHPFGFVLAFAPQGLEIEVLFETLFNMFGQRLNVGPRSAGRNHKDVRENKLLFDIENRDV